MDTNKTVIGLCVRTEEEGSDKLMKNRQLQAKHSVAMI